MELTGPKLWDVMRHERFINCSTHSLQRHDLLGSFLTFSTGLLTFLPGFLTFFLSLCSHATVSKKDMYLKPLPSTQNDPEITQPPTKPQTRSDPEVTLTPEEKAQLLRT